MEKLIILIGLLFSFQIHGQVILDINSNFPLNSKPNSVNKKDQYISNNLGIIYNLQKGDYNIGYGLKFTRIAYTTYSYIDGFEYAIKDFNGSILDTGYIDSPMNLKETSNTIGLYVSLNKKVVDLGKTFGQCGFDVTFNFWEYFWGRLVSENGDAIPSVPSSFTGNLVPPSNGTTSPFSRFFLSSINFSTYYKHVWQLKDNFSIAGRVSIGTNLYSDWDQFKKYVWLGAGLEFGFGRPRSFGKKNISEELD